MRIPRATLASILGVLSSGCVLVAGGAAAAGTYVWMDGNVESVESAELSEVHAAALGALDEMGVEITEQRADRTAGRIRAETAAGKTVRIDLEPGGVDRTKVRIRVGTMGDKDLSQAILEAMRKRY